MLYKIHKKQRAFSYGETLMALFVISIGLLSVIRLFQGSLSQTLYLRDATIASGLSQEGVEIVRNIRDNNFVGGGNGFDTGSPATGISSANKHCLADYSSTTLQCQATQGNNVLYSLRANGFGLYRTQGAGTTEQRFRRYLYVDYNSSTATALVRSFVVWGNAVLPPSTGATTTCTIRNKCVYTEVVLTNWRS